MRSGECSDYCGVFVLRNSGSASDVVNIIIFLVSCIILYASRKKIKLGGSKLWVIPELLALLSFLSYFVSIILGFARELVVFLSASSFFYFLDGMTGLVFLWKIFIIFYGIWTIIAYLSVWHGNVAIEPQTRLGSIKKAALIIIAFILLNILVIGSLLSLRSFAQYKQNQICNKQMLELRDELGAIICTTDEQCSANGGQYFAPNPKYRDLDYGCGDLRLKCRAGKCTVPND